jgi:ribonuclease HI
MAAAAPADVMAAAAPAQRLQQQQTRWQPPDADYLKCNVDAAIFEEQRSFGIGMCIRDSHGNFIKASIKWYDGVPPPSEAEAMGLKDAILWLGQLGLSKVQIELDCKLVVESILDRTNSQSEFGTIINMCRSLLQQFSNFEISFVRRQANYVAHGLARESKLYTRHHVFDSIPSCINSILLNEII